MPSGEDDCVIRLLAEGAGIDVRGRKEPDGSWSFVGYGGTMDIDEDGNDSVHLWGIRRCKSLSEALPDNAWIRFMPTHVHPELREWFRSRYDAAVAALSEYERQRHDALHHRKWQALFNSTPPDRWSDDF
jgi:hypothetical protein